MNAITLPADLNPTAVRTAVQDSAELASRGLGAQLLANRAMTEMFTAFYQQTRAFWDFGTATLVNRAPRPVGPAHVRYFVTKATNTDTLTAVAAPAEYAAEVDEKGETVTITDEFNQTHTLQIRSGLNRTLRREGLAATSPLIGGRLTVRIVCD